MKPDVERYRWLTMRREDDFNVLADLAGTSASGSWRPLRVEWIDDDLNSRLPKGDFPTLGSTPTLSQRAVDELIDVLVENGEILPLDVATGEPCYVYNVTRTVDALDESRSDLVRFDSGRIMMVKRHAFRAPELEGVTIFKVPQLRAPVFVTEPLMKRITQSGLTGFSFRQIWQNP